MGLVAGLCTGAADPLVFETLLTGFVTGDTSFVPVAGTIFLVGVGFEAALIGIFLTGVVVDVGLVVEASGATFFVATGVLAVFDTVGVVAVVVLVAADVAVAGTLSFLGAFFTGVGVEIGASTGGAATFFTGVALVADVVFAAPVETVFFAGCVVV